jgi:hypothetical protein
MGTMCDTTTSCDGVGAVQSRHGSVIGHDIGGKYIPIMARLAKGQTLE